MAGILPGSASAPVDGFGPYTYRLRVRGAEQVRKNLTITLDEEVYEGLHRVVGWHISGFLTELARPHVVQDGLEARYRADGRG